MRARRCANPIAVAQTPDQQAFALLSVYAAVLETAADLARDPAVPAAVKRALSEAEATATPVVLALTTVFDAYAQAPDEAAAQALADATARAQSPLVVLQAAVLPLLPTPLQKRIGPVLSAAGWVSALGGTPDADVASLTVRLAQVRAEVEALARAGRRPAMTEIHRAVARVGVASAALHEVLGIAEADGA